MRWRIALLLIAVCAWPLVARADRDHVVRSGQTVSAIAHRYDVSVSALLAANGLGRNATLRAGQVLRVPARGEVFVGRGDTLTSIARAHGSSVEALCRANGLRDTSTLREGQRLMLPGHDVRSARRGGEPRAERSYGPPRRAGVVRFSRSRRQTTVRLVDRRGRATRAGRRALAAIMAEPSSGRRRVPPARLVEVVARISDHFGGRRIFVASGVRTAGGYTRETSRHTRGHAIDLHVEGVPNTVVRDYARSLGSVGVGYYPNSSFVHVDVRDRPGYWVDYSGPGQMPKFPRQGVVVDRAAVDGETLVELRPATSTEGADDGDEAGEGLQPGDDIHENGAADALDTSTPGQEPSPDDADGPT